MSSQDFKRIIDALNRVTAKVDHDEIVKVFGSTYNDARDLVCSKKIHRILFRPSNRVVWIVKGERKDYQVLSNVAFCTCYEFYSNIINGNAVGCKHLIAQKIALELKDYTTCEKKDDEYENFCDDLNKQRMLTLNSEERMKDGRF